MILLLYHQKPRAQRMAISAHLNSFQQYSPGTFVYWNIAYGLPDIIAECNFEAVVFHFTFFIPNITTPFDGNFRHWDILQKLDVPKFAFLQDEYIHTDVLCKFLKRYKVETIFTCLPASLYQEVYPFERSGINQFHTVLTGYIEESLLDNFSFDIKPHSERKHDIVYRARKMPFNLGSFGALKWQLTENFLKANNKHNLSIDISNDPNDFIFGSNWYKFIADSRTILGSEGGSGIHDRDGSIRSCSEKLTLANPNIDLESVLNHCIGDKDNQFPYFALSPRHFEAAASKTCQVLIEGNYNGVFQPDIHYIPIKKDWSNLDEVFEKIKDSSYCEQMADRAYHDIVLSGKYTYQVFVNEVMSIINKKTKHAIPNIDKINTLKSMLEKKWRYFPKAVVKNILLESTKQIIWKLNLDKMAWFKKLEYKFFKTTAVR